MTAAERKAAARAKLPGVTLAPAGWMLRTVAHRDRREWNALDTHLHYLAMAASTRKNAKHRAPQIRQQIYRVALNEAIWARAARQHCLNIGARFARVPA